MKKRLVAIVTAMALVLAMIPALAFAADGDITVTVTIKNNNFTAPLLNDQGKTVNPRWRGAVVENYAVTLADGQTAADAIETACKDNGIAYICSGGYFSNIEGMKGGMAGIKTDAAGWGSYYDMSGWMFQVNGSAPGWNGATDMVNSATADADKQLKDKDAITMAYSIDNVTADTPYEQSIKVDKTALKLAKGKTAALKATILPAYSEVASKGATWSTSDATVAKVDAAGKVTAASAGIATITAKADNTMSSTSKITIDPAKTTITRAKGKKKAVALKWKKQTDATGYVIYRATKKAGKYKVVKTINKKSTTTWTNKKLKKGKKYFYKIKVYKKSKGGKVVSAFSAVKGAKTK